MNHENTRHGAEIQQGPGLEGASLAARDPEVWVLDQVTSSLLRASVMAVSVLRTVMLDAKAPAASRVRAAEKTLEMAFRLIELGQEEARRAELEHLDPRQAALQTLTPDELMILREAGHAQAEGKPLSRDQIMIMNKYANLAQEFLARKGASPSAPLNRF